MHRNPNKVSVGGAALTMLVFLNIIALKLGWVTHTNWYWLLWVSIPALIVSIVVFRRRKW